MNNIPVLVILGLAILCLAAFLLFHDAEIAHWLEKLAQRLLTW
ncbi:conserved exported protein of unknown function [Xenorhabdus poinarii G6]|uniref:Uncharacterized protein n=1 Tax=Xenorhabdus poinarii G6 TaxID=1354304 RepID=A0A068R3Y5_9GAMM|nr:conserved exported protein of unknown function [Xenorhabdus poinarii G6]